MMVLGTGSPLMSSVALLRQKVILCIKNFNLNLVNPLELGRAVGELLLWNPLNSWPCGDRDGEGDSFQKRLGK